MTRPIQYLYSTMTARLHVKIIQILLKSIPLKFDSK